MSAIAHSSLADGTAPRPDVAEEPVTCELGYAPSDVVDALLRGAARLRRHLIITQELRSGSGQARGIAANGERRMPPAPPIRTSGAQWYYTAEGHAIGFNGDQR